MMLNIGDGVTSKLVHGTMEKLSVSIPWTRLRSGGLEICIDKLHLCVQLSVDQASDLKFDETQTLLHKLKMVLPCNSYAGKFFIGEIVIYLG
jgi:hypothetical protein